MLARLSLITLHYSSVFRRDQCLACACLFNTYKTSMTFSSVMQYIIICLLTTCMVTAADDLTTFLQLSPGLKAVSSTFTPGAAPNVYSSTSTRQSYGIAAVSAAISEHYHPGQPVHHKASDCRLCGSTRSYQCACTFLGWHRHVLLFAPNAVR